MAPSTALAVENVLDSFGFNLEQAYAVNEDEIVRSRAKKGLSCEVYSLKDAKRGAKPRVLFNREDGLVRVKHGPNGSGSTVDFQPEDIDGIRQKLQQLTA